MEKKMLLIGILHLLVYFSTAKGGVGPRQSKGQSTASNSNAIHSGEAILHFRSKEPAIVKMEKPAWEAAAIKKVNDMLEGFLGIRDLDLATKLIDIWKHEENPSEFVEVVDEEFGNFEFPDDFVFHIWETINDAKAGKL